MSLLERFTTRLVKQTKETVSKMAKEDVHEKVDVVADLVKLGLLVGITASALKSPPGAKPAVEAASTVLPMVQIVLSEGKEVVIR